MKARAIRLSFSNDFETMGIKPCDLDSGTITSFDVAMKPKAKGKHLLRITTTYQSEYDIEYKQTFDFPLDVKEGK